MSKKHNQQTSRNQATERTEPERAEPPASSPSVVSVAKPLPARLTDAEADFILQRVLWALESVAKPIDFFRGMGRGVVFGVTEENRTAAREMVRLLARGEEK